MLLSPEDGELFFKLNRALMFFVAQRSNLVDDDVTTPNQFSSSTLELRLNVREAFLKAHADFIDSFLAQNPPHLQRDELDIVASWRHLVHGRFYIFRELKNYTVFLSSDQPPIAYGVLAVTETFEELVDRPLPILVEALLLPFKNRIV